MARMTRAAYAATYGPTTGDLVRLGDTSLLAEVERDHAVYGEECMTGAGKVMRDGMGFDAHATAASGALDMLVQNATIIDPVLGVVKGDIGIRDGTIVAVGKAGNPAIQSGVHPDLRCGPSTTIVHGDRLIVTPGGVEAHAHFLCPQQCEHALAGGLTTIVGGTMGPHFDISCAGPRNLALMLKAAEQYPLNFGFLGRGSGHDPAAIVESVAGGETSELCAENALQSTEIVFACWESSRRRGLVHLPLDVDDNPLEAMILTSGLSFCIARIVAAPSK